MITIKPEKFTDAVEEAYKAFSRSLIVNNLTISSPEASRRAIVKDTVDAFLCTIAGETEVVVPLPPEREDIAKAEYVYFKRGKIMYALQRISREEMGKLLSDRQTKDLVSFPTFFDNAGRFWPHAPEPIDIKFELKKKWWLK